MLTLEKIKSSPLAGIIKKTLKTRWLLLLFIPTLIVPLTVLKTLSEEGQAVFSAQKGALVMEVFSRTDLAPENYKLLEENLRALEGVKEVIAVSPEESLAKISEDPKFGIDPQWLMKKKEDLKGKDTLLPWSYDLHLAKWDEKFLAGLLGTIENMEVGQNKIKAVSEIHYDRERWTLTFALFNYVRWLKRVLGFLLSLVLGIMGYLAVKVRRKFTPDQELVTEAVGFFSIGILGALASHALYLAILSISFFPETFSWKNQLGRSLIFQIGLSILFSFCAHASLLFERRRG